MANILRNPTFFRVESPVPQDPDVFPNLLINNGVTPPPIVVAQLDWQYQADPVYFADTNQLGSPLALRLAPGGVISVSSATTDGADVLLGNISVIVAASSATTDGADVLAGNLSTLVAVSSATTDGADVLLANVDSTGTVSVSSATTDGADILAGNLSVLVAVSSATTDGADVLLANVAPLSTISVSSATTDGADVLSAHIDSGHAAIFIGGDDVPPEEKKPKKPYRQSVRESLTAVVDPAPLHIEVPPIKEAEETRPEPKARVETYPPANSKGLQGIAEDDEEDIEILLLSL